MEATEYLEKKKSPIQHRSNKLIVSKSITSQNKNCMIPTANFLNMENIKNNDIQAVPNMESDSAVKSTSDSLFSECVLDFSKYLSTADLPAAPGEFFDDLFHGKLSKDALQRHLPGLIKIKKEPDSTATSRCSTPESLLPEHDFDNGDFPTPQFQDNTINPRYQKGGLMINQFQYISSSNGTSENDSDDDINVEVLDFNAQRLKAALIKLEQSKSDEISHRNELKSPRSKSRKTMSKGSEEYLVKRERNNVAVRKSRTKAKLKHIETQMRVGELTEENDQLRNRIASLQKELDTMKSFFEYNSLNEKSSYFSSYPAMFSATKLL